MRPTAAQELAEAYLAENFDQVLFSEPNEQNNVLLIAIERDPKSEAGREILRWVIRPNGFVFFASYTPGNGELFNTVLDGYYRLMPSQAG